jgi:hypothetical protein
MNWDNLRRYGPGKFEGGFAVDAVVYGVSPDEAIGDADTTGWNGLVRGGFAAEDAETLAREAGAGELNADEVAYLTDAAGFVVSEDSQGFVVVDRHETESELMNAWRTCEADVEEQCDA